MKIIVILFMLFAMSAAKVHSFGPEISRSGKFFRIDDQREEKILFVRRDVILSISVELRPAEEEGEFAQLILTTEEVSARQPRNAPRDVGSASANKTYWFVFPSQDEAVEFAKVLSEG